MKNYVENVLAPKHQGDGGWVEFVSLENGQMTVIRLCEQDGKRGEIKLLRKVKLLNMLEDIEGETDIIEYKPFEIITIGI